MHQETSLSRITLSLLINFDLQIIDLTRVSQELANLLSSDADLVIMFSHLFSLLKLSLQVKHPEVANYRGGMTATSNTTKFPSESH